MAKQVARHIAGFTGACIPLALASLLTAVACATTSSRDEPNDLLTLVSHADYAALSARACEGGALAFAPYTKNLSTLDLTRLSAAELRSFSVSKRIYTWGRYDGSGDPIRLTPMAFHRRFVWDIDYGRRARPQRLDSAHLRERSDLAAVEHAFPGAEAIIYRYEGNERVDRKDARELILVGRPRSEGWCLLALTHDEDTV